MIAEAVQSRKRLIINPDWCTLYGYNQKKCKILKFRIAGCVLGSARITSSQFDTKAIYVLSVVVRIAKSRTQESRIRWQAIGSNLIELNSNWFNLKSVLPVQRSLAQPHGFAQNRCNKVKRKQRPKKQPVRDSNLVVSFRIVTSIAGDDESRQTSVRSLPNKNL